MDKLISGRYSICSEPKRDRHLSMMKVGGDQVLAGGLINEV